MASDRIEITIAVDRNEAASMTFGQRQSWLGKLAEEQLARTIPPRPPMNGSPRDRWQPYTRETIAAAFQERARLRGGKAPSKADWSRSRDPERHWPRPEGTSFRATLAQLAEEDGIALTSTAPCRNDDEQVARMVWHRAQDATATSDGHLERTVPLLLGSRVEIVQRWEPHEVELGADPGPYCEECFDHSGCRPADMSPWQYAVEMIGGLTRRNGGDFQATRSRRDEFGRNRQMVTGGAADAYPEPSDPAARTAIETITTG